MGTIFSRTYSRLFSGKRMRLLMLGLDSAGKSTILYKLKLGDVNTSDPDIGMNLEILEYRNVSITSFNVSGSSSDRQLWRHFHEHTQGLIFVVDSIDRDRIDDAREELQKLVNNEFLKEAVVLVLANKQDLPGAMTVDEITEKLKLCTIRARNWLIQGCCAVNGDNLYEGLEWITTAIYFGNNR